MKHKTRTKALSWLLSLALMLSLVPGMSLTARADGHDHSSWTAWSSADSLPTTADSYYLTKDVTISSTWNVPGTTNLCLNGHSITYTGSNGSVIKVPQDAVLNLFDCGENQQKYSINNGLAQLSEDGGKTFTGGYITGGNYSGNAYDNTDSCVSVAAGGTFTMNGGTIIGNSYKNGGGVNNSGTFTMNDGSIIGNTASNTSGGVANGGTFTMNGGSIVGNKAEYTGGGVKNAGTFIMNDGSINNNTANSGGGVNISSGTFTMSGGSITDNTANYGGGVCNYGTFTMSGGSITGNTANSGGGVDNSGTFNLSGSPTIAGNKKGGNANNVYVGSYCYIIVTGALINETPIGVSMESPGAFTYSNTDSLKASDYAAKFASDDSAYSVFAEGNELKLAKPTISYREAGWNGTKVTFETKTSNDYEVVTSSTSSFMSGKWYVVKDNATVDSRITVNGTANLILCDGATLTASKGITVESGKTLNIYAGSTGESITGSGTLTSNDVAESHAGIGGTSGVGGTVNIHGGTVNVTGGSYGAGIGGGAGSGGKVTIYDGTVTATGGESGAGIGGGRSGSSDKITIYGGTVNATGGSGGAGIGGGEYFIAYGGKGADVTITGGTVTATGGADAVGIGHGKGGTGYNADGSLTPGTGVSISVSTDNSTWSAYDGNNRTQYMKASYAPSHTHDEITFTAWSSADGLPTEAGSYYLTQDVTISETWTVPTGETNLCLNGHSVVSTGNSYAIDIQNGQTLNLYDEGEGEHKYTLVARDTVSTFGQVNDEATGDAVKTFNGGYITVNGKHLIVNLYQGAFNMNGGTLIGGAGGARIQSGTFTMSGGNILGNSSVGVNVDGTFTMTGGTISYNTHGSWQAGGGGVSVNGYSTFTLSGGTISHNTAGNALGENNHGFGGGVFVGRGATFNLSGNPTIADNNDSVNPSNVGLADAGNYSTPITTTIHITGELTYTNPIGVMKVDSRSGGGFMPTPGVFTEGWTTYMSDKTPTNYFTSESTYPVEEQDNELVLAVPQPIPYMAWDETTKTVKAVDGGCTDYTVVTCSTATWENGKWYVVKDDVTISDRITVNGTANLILCDGKTLTASEGITVGSGKTLNIYAQSADTGALIAQTNDTVHDGSWSGGGAGIGGERLYTDGTTKNSGDIVIHGGNITARGGYSSAGIGGGYFAASSTDSGQGGNGGTVTINGGTVTAFGGNSSAGIGGGWKNGVGTLTINGGTVNATGGNGGAGIGGGNNNTMGSGTGYANSGTVTINGGTVNATGGSNGAGIGGGYIGNGGTVTITDGTVTAAGGFGAAGIGGGLNAGGGNVTINGGAVTAVGGNGMVNDHYNIADAVGIGGGSSSSGGGRGTDGSLTLGTGMYLYGGTSENPEIDLSNHVPQNNGDYARSRYMTVNNDVPHFHSFTYTATGETITATCSNHDGCPLADSNYQATLTIVAPTLTTYGQTGDDISASATLTGLDAFKAATGKTIAATDIKYVGRDGTTYEESATAPTGAGKYTAKITVESKTASVDYEIAKKAPAVSDFTYLAPSALTYSGTEKTATVVAKDSIDGMGQVTVKYYSDASCSNAVERPTDAGTYYVGVEVAEGTNYSASSAVLHDESWKFTINKATPNAENFTYSAPESLDYDGHAKSAAVVPKDGITGMGGVTVKYYSDAGRTHEVQTPTNAGTYYVGVEVAEGTNYSATSAVLHGGDWQFTINKATPAVGDFTYTAPSELTYNGTAKAATVVPKDGITGMGTVTVKYYSDAAYNNEVQSPTDVGTYYVGIVVAEGDNYNAALGVLHGDGWEFTINKADPTATAPTATATYGQTLNDVTLTNPNGNTEGEWAWVDSATSVGAVGERTFKADFTPTDTANYNSKSNVDVTVAVNKADSTLTTVPTAKTLTYDGTAQALVTAGEGVEGGTLKYKLGVSGLYSTAIPTATEAGTYTVYYKVFGDSNYNDTEEASVTATIIGASITYSDGSAVTTPKFGETVKATIVPEAADGTKYQWYRGDSAGFTPADANKIDGATAATHAIALGDIDHYLKVVVTPTEGEAYTLSLAAKVQKAAAPAAPATLTATATVNSITVTEPTSGDGTTYEYKLNNGAWQTATTFSGLNEDTAYMLYVRVKAPEGYNEGTAKSATVYTLRTAIESVSITGTAQIGKTLTASYSPANAAGVTYQWYRCATESGDYQAIEGATGKTYTLSGAVNVDKYIKVVATQTNPNGDNVVRTSSATGPVTKAGAEKIVISEARNIEKTSTTIKVKGLPAADNKYTYYLLATSGNALPTEISGFSGGTTQSGTATFTGLTANTAYYVAVKFNGDETTNAGQMTNVLTVRTSSKAPSSATVAPSVSNFTYGASVTATKTGTGDATLYYGKSSNVRLGTWTDNSTSVTLNVGTYYIWAEIAETNDTAAYKSAATQFKVTPKQYDTPTSVTATANSAAGTVTVSVTQGETHGTLEYAVVSGSETDYSGSYLPMTGTTATLSGLTSGSAYTVFVRERSSANGNYSASDAAYAQFTPTFSAFTVSYNANGGTGAPAMQTVVAPTLSTTVAHPGTMSRTGYTFNGWNTAANGSGEQYAAEATISSGATLYAQWTPIVYTVSFAGTDKTGGDAPSALTKAYDSEWTIPAAGTLTRTGYNFAGWTTVSGGMAVEYTAGQKVKNLTGVADTVTLYPVWVVESYTVTGNVTSISNSPVTLTLKRGEAILKETTATVLAPGDSGFTATTDFTGVPAGVYNLVAEQTINGIPVTKTVIVTLTDSNMAAAISITSGTANSAVEVKEDTPAAVVGNLDAEAESHAQDDQKIQFIMTLEKQEPQELSASATEEQQEIQEAISGIQELSAVADNVTLKDSLEFIDVTVNKETTNISDVGTANEATSTTTERIRETTNVVQIGIPYNPLAWTKTYGVHLFYNHNGVAKQMTRGSTAAGGFVVDSALGMIFIYTNEFSTYALGYDSGATQNDDDPDTQTYSSGGSAATYAVTLNPAQNGSVSASHKSAASGVKVTITVKSDVGYAVDTVTVTDANSKSVSVTKVSDTTYTFTMPSGKVTVNATFTNGTCPQDSTCPISKFTDADAKAWYHDGVHWALDNGVMQGVSPKYFSPNGNTTRAMVVTMLWRMEGSPAYAGASEFSDVDSEQWYGQAVRWANAEGIVEGYSNTKFGPNDAVTREQLAAILYRYAQYKKADVSVSADLGSFNDAATVSGWATSAMQWAVGSGIINGMDGNLVPTGNATRAQVATMLMRYSTAK